MDPATDDDDPRATELETLQAIYPELRRLEGSSSSSSSSSSSFTFDLELPVEPAAPVTVTFPAASAEAAIDATAAAATAAAATAAAATAQKQTLNGSTSGPQVVLLEDSLQVSYLPPLSLRITLPDGYPAERAPLIAVSTTPQWLSASALKQLEDEGSRLWEEMGRDLVAYAYIDHVQRAADDVFGAITAEGTLEVDPEHKLAVLDYDIKAKKVAFEKETFECGICLDPKKGSKCHKMLDCNHVFCLQCLQAFYNDAIQEGNLSTIRCLAPNCAKTRTAAAVAAAAASASKAPKGKKLKAFISPSELLQIGLSEDTVRRYVNLKYKTELESDKNTIFCPRQWCNGAARSNKHKKPSGLDFAETSDNESDEDTTGETEDGKGKSKQSDRFSRGDLLCVCDDCGFAFCSRCFQSWHGEFFYCTARKENGELTEEEKASLEYLKLHTSPCPTCSAPAQKTQGCNHMICSRCDTHFCYLCSAWLDPENPYRHYNQQPNGRVTSCYMRLWELEGGDGDDVGLGFAGGGGAVIHQPPAEAEVIIEQDAGEWAGIEIEEVDSTDSEAEGNDNNAAGQLNGDGQRVAVAREAPLVLRLMDNNRHINNDNNQVRGAVPDAAAGRRPADHQPRQVARGRGAGIRAAGAAARVAGHIQNHHQAGHAPNARGHHPAAVGAAPLPHAGRARGRGARRARDGRGGGREAGAAAVIAGGRGAGRQNHQQHHHQQPRRQVALAPAPRNNNQDHNGNGNGDALDPVQEAWVRRFVQMALIDAEDEVEEGDSDEDNILWHIR